MLGGVGEKIYLCIPNSVKRLKGEYYGDNDIEQNTSASLADVSSG